MEIEEDKKDLINREINKFRDAHKVEYLIALVNKYLISSATF